MLWKFPFKPVRASWSIFKIIDPSKYTLELKFDGFRAVVQVGKEVSLWTREKVPIAMPDNLRDQLEKLELPEGTVLDGEIWNMSKRGSWRHNPKEVCSLTLWDAVRVGHRDLSAQPIEERRKALEGLLSGKNTPQVQTTEVFPALEDIARKADVEARDFREGSNSRSGYIHGVVLKRKGSPRRDNPIRCVEHSDWLKVVFSGMGSGL